MKAPDYPDVPSGTVKARKLKIEAMGDFAEGKVTPQIRLKGLWLSDAGFKPGKSVDVVVQNRLVRVCCNDCKAEIEKDPAAAFKKLDAAVIAAQKPGYPRKISPGSTTNWVNMSFRRGTSELPTVLT